MFYVTCPNYRSDYDAFHRRVSSNTCAKPFPVQPRVYTSPDGSCNCRVSSNMCVNTFPGQPRVYTGKTTS